MAFHPGETALQRRTGVRREAWGTAHVPQAIPDVAADFLRTRQLLVLGASDDAGRVWADVVTGPAGFAEPLDDRTVAIAARPPILGPVFEREHEIGLIAIEPAARRRMRVNGTARYQDGRLLITTQQVFANCPKYITTRSHPGGPAAPGVPRTGSSLTDAHRALIARSDAFFVATRADGLGADVSHRGGNPGFVVATGPRTLTWPDYVGNGMYMTLGNLELDPSCGLVFPDWEGGRTLHLTGTAGVDWDEDRARAVPGALRMIDFTLDQVIELPGGVPAGWSPPGYFRHNPPLP